MAMPLEFTESSCGLEADADFLSQEYLEAGYNRTFRPPCHWEVLPLEHQLCSFRNLAGQDLGAATYHLIVDKGNHTFKDLNNDFRSLDPHQLTHVEHHRSRAISSNTASESLKWATCANQVPVPNNHFNSFNNDIDDNIYEFEDFSWENTFSRPGPACTNVPSLILRPSVMTNTTNSDFRPEQGAQFESAIAVPESLPSSHNSLASNINPTDQGNRGPSSPTYSKSEILELRRISANSEQGFNEENPDSSFTTPLMLNPLAGPLTVRHCTIAPKSGPSTPSQQVRFQCPELSCGRSFNRSTDRERHMRSHSKEREFACLEPGCRKRFYRKDKLMDHSRRGHRNRKHTCICLAKNSGEAE